MNKYVTIAIDRVTSTVHHQPQL